jgi:hypothetical protein
VKQIDSDQIVDNGIPDNTIKPIPRDLGDLKFSSSGKSGLGLLNLSSFSSVDLISEESSSAPSTPSIPLPETPNLIGVKTQTVKIKEDGTYAVDVVIEVEDIRNVSDYEVRISKGAGTI